MMRLTVSILVINCCFFGWTTGNFILGPTESVNGGEYLYYNLSNINSYVYLQLETNVGDCDLYVCEKEKYPTFEDYSLHSATCGIDTVLVKKRVKGPVYIGIYGHPAFDTSECLLKLCLLEQPEHVDEFTDEMMESSALVENIGDICFIEKRSEGRGGTNSVLGSFIGRSLSAVGSFVRRIEFDGIIAEFIALFVQSLI